MRKYARLTESGILDGIEKTETVIRAGRAYLAFLATGQGLPRNLGAREELAEVHTKLINKQEEILEELHAELRRRK